MRIAYIDQAGEMGGAEHLLLTLLDGLPREKVQALLICGQDGPFVDQARRRGIQTLVVPLPALYSTSWVVNQRKLINPLAVLWNVVSLFRSAWRVRWHLRNAQIDLVQTNSAFAHIYGGLAARMAGVPCIWYFHDLVETTRLAGTISLIWRILAGGLATRVVGVSEAVIKSLGAGSPGRVIYAGLPAQQTSNQQAIPELRSQLGLPGDTRLVGYIGRIAFAKGLDVLVQAAKQIVQTDPHVHFVLFGEVLFGERECKHALVSMVERLHLGKYWHWMGYDQIAASRIAEFDLLVLPSRREALGLVLLEAGMAGKAAVASRVGGTPEVIADGETGILVSPENADELAAAILQLLMNPHLSSEMGGRANKRVRELFDVQRYHTEFLKTYASLEIYRKFASFVCP